MYFPCSLSGCSITDFPVNHAGPGRYTTRYVALAPAWCGLTVSVRLCAGQYIGARLSTRNKMIDTIVATMGLTRIEQIGNLRDRRDSPRGRMGWEDHESKR